MYVLEVVQFIIEKDGENGWLAQHGKKKHIGYMKGKFKTKKCAVSYYDRHNQHMRSLNVHNTYCSDWDPNTHLMYIVRKDLQVNANVDCFSINDNPIVKYGVSNKFMSKISKLLK